MLFINAVDRHLDAFLDTFSLGREDEQLGRCFRRELQFRYDHDSHTFEIFAARHSKDECYIGEVLGGIALTNESPIYKHCARLAFIEVSSVPSDQAIDDFFAAVCSAQPAVAGAKNRP